MKRKKLLTSIVLGLGLGGYIGGSEISHFMEGEKHRETYGTLENPVFLMRNNPENGSQIRTYSDTYGLRNEKRLENAKKAFALYGELDEALTKYEKAVDEVSEKYKDKKPSDISRKEDLELIRARGKVSNIDINTTTMSASLLLLRNAIDDITDPFSDTDELLNDAYLQKLSAIKTRNLEQETYGDVIDRAKGLYKIITGRDAPKGIKLSIENPEHGDAIGTHSFLEKKIKSEDASYARTLSTLMHELGHDAEQHSESTYYQLFGRLKLRTNELTVRSEACAYTLQIASSDYEEDPNLSKIMNVLNVMNMKYFVEDWFRGEQQPHRRAMAVADAAITHFGNAKDAFNYLATTPWEKELKPGIVTIMNNNRDNYLQLSKFGDQNEGASERIGDKREKLENKIERCMNHLDELYDCAEHRIKWNDIPK